MAHKDWMRAGRRVSHKIDVTPYIGPRCRIYTYRYSEESDASGNLYGVSAYNNTTTEYNEEKLSTNYGSGKNIGFFDGPEQSIHLMSETLSYNLYSENLDTDGSTIWNEDRGNSRFCTKFITDKNGDIRGYVDGISVNYFIFDINIWPGEETVSPTTRYLQISGNSNTNDFPVNFEIKNNTDGSIYYIDGNSKVDCIIDFGKEIDVSGSLTIKVTKWSKPYSSVKFSYIGYDVNFDVADLLRTYDIDNGCAYDGGDNFSYGVKANTGSISLYKDKNNKASIKKPLKSFNNILSGGFSYSFSPIENFDEGNVDASGEKFYVLKQNYLYMSNYIGWENNVDTGVNNYTDGYGVVNLDVMNNNSVEVSIRPAFIFAFNASDSLASKMFMCPETIKLKPKEWTKISYIYTNKNNPSGEISPVPGLNSEQFINFNIGTGNTEGIFVKNIRVGIASNEDIEAVGAKQGTLYKDLFVNDKNNNSIVVYDKAVKLSTLSKISSIIANDNTNFKISVSTIGDPFKQVANMWLENYDYDQNGIGVTFNISDIFSKMSKDAYPGISAQVEKGVIDSVSSYIEGRVVQKAFFTSVSNGSDIRLRQYALPNFSGYMNMDPTIPNVLDCVGEKYFNILNNASKAMNTFIVQDAENKDLMFRYCGKNSSNSFEIRNSQLYDIVDKRYEKNTINNITINKATPLDGQSSLIHEDDEFVLCKPLYYTSADLVPQGNGSWEDFVVVDKDYVAMEEINITGQQKIPVGTYNKYKRVYAGIKCVTSYRHIDTSAIGFTGLEGEDIDDYKNTRLFLTTMNGSEERTNNISDVTSDDIDIVIGSQNIKIVDIDNENVTVEYFLRFNPVYFKSHFGKQYTYKDTEAFFPGSGLTLNRKYIQKYLGAYKFCIFGEEVSYETTQTKYGDNYGSSIDINAGMFIQQDSIVDRSEISGVTEGDDLALSIAKDIYNEYSNGKKIAKIDYIGSPYLKVYDIITLENGISYRLLKIKHISNGGGFKQQLILMEKE